MQFFRSPGSRALLQDFRYIFSAGSAIVVLLFAWFAVPAQATTFPLKVSADGRFLTDQNNVPFRVQGDAPWDLLVTITSSEVDTYLANRAAKGFNALLIYLVEHRAWAAG
jgi:hypothetical protein